MKIDVLDHGYVELLNISGPVRRSEQEYDASDIDPALTARICFNKFEEERTKEKELKLVDYLVRNSHTSPLEMIETWWHVKLPIFVARQIVRHRTAAMNEISGRYSTLPEDWYIPEVVGGKCENNKQGQTDNLSESLQKSFKFELNAACERDYLAYKDYLAKGVAPEHARMLLHLNHYTVWIWKMDYHNMSHFLKLRLDNRAQIETRAYAQAKYDLLKKVLPDLMNLFDKYHNPQKREEI